MKQMLVQRCSNYNKKEFPDPVLTWRYQMTGLKIVMI